MKKFFKIIVSAAIILTVVFSAVSCSKTPENAISQADYDAIKAQLSEAQAKINELLATTTQPAVSLNEQALKDEITTLQAQIDKLGNDITNLNTQNDALVQEKSDLEQQYAELNTKYTNLQKSIPTQTPEPKVELTAEAIENEIFRLINLERTKAGIPELMYGKNLHLLTISNDKNMLRLGRYDYDVSVAYQEVFWGINYESLESITTAAMKTWTLNTYRFKTTALLVTNTYGAVGAYYDNGVYFITFMAANYP
jgi:TolA-binding protein